MIAAIFAKIRQDGWEFKLLSDYQIAALWIGGALSYLEHLCLKSFVDQGHTLTLYSYHPVENAPQGVILANANSVLPEAGLLRHGRTGSPALHSDLFRYHLLSKSKDVIWADTDAYCVKPFRPKDGYFFAWESKNGVNGGVLALPPDSEALSRLLAFTADEYAIPPWFSAELRHDYREKAAKGSPVHVSEMPWGVWGPAALTYFLKESGELRHALTQEALYPFAYHDRNLLLRPSFDMALRVTEDTYSIHFYGRRLRARILAHEKEAIPRPRSVLGRLLRQHDIDPKAAPLQAKFVHELTPA